MIPICPFVRWLSVSYFPFFSTTGRLLPLLVGGPAQGLLLWSCWVLPLLLLIRG